MLDSLAPATAGVATHLHLLEHTGSKLLLDDARAMAITDPAGVNLTVLAASSLTFLTNDLLVPLELGRGTVVKIAKGYLDTDLDVVSSRLTRVSTGMAVSTEESTEKIKGVVSTTTAAAAIPALLDAVVAVAVIDLAHLSISQHIVGLRDLDELVMGCVVTAGKGLAKVPCGRGGLEGYTDSCLDGIFWTGDGTQTLDLGLKLIDRHQEP